MSDNWIWCSWGDIATLEYGKALSDYRDSSGSIPVYGTNGAIGWTDRPLCNFPSVIVGRKGAYRGIHYSSTSFFVIDTAFYLKPLPNARFDTKWAYYYLLTQDINQMDSGSAIPSTSRDDFYALEVLLPPLDEQSKIVSVLSTLDDKIEANRRMNETLEATARAIFKSWFVDFDPVHYKSRGETPPGMDTETAALFPDSFEDSELGLIPSGWRVGTIADMADIERGTVNPANHIDELFWHYSLPAYDEGKMPKPDFGRDIKSNKHSLPKGSVLLSKLNPQNMKVWIPMPYTDYRSIASTEFLVMMAQNGFSREYLYTLFNSDEFSRVFANLVTGTSSSHQRVKPAYLLGIDAVVPTQAVVEAFTRIAEPIYQQVLNHLDQSRSLAATRDALLPKLVSGEVRVGEVKELL
jgi:type I restriction enzyme, S subunit